MAWTYTDPSTYPRDEFRLLIGDTDTTDQVFSDAEVAYFLAQNTNVKRAAAIGCRAAAAKYARKINYSLGDLSEQLVQKVQNFTALAKELDNSAKRASFSSTTATISTVKDVATYPERFIHGEEVPPTWDIDG